MICKNRFAKFFIIWVSLLLSLNPFMYATLGSGNKRDHKKSAMTNKMTNNKKPKKNSKNAQVSKRVRQSLASRQTRRQIQLVQSMDTMKTEDIGNRNGFNRNSKNNQNKKVIDVVFVGPKMSGKTTLLNALFGKNCTENAYEATQGIEVDNYLVYMDLVVRFHSTEGNPESISDLIKFYNEGQGKGKIDIVVFTASCDQFIENYLKDSGISVNDHYCRNCFRKINKNCGINFIQDDKTDDQIQLINTFYKKKWIDAVLKENKYAEFMFLGTQMDIFFDYKLLKVENITRQTMEKEFLKSIKELAKKEDGSYYSVSFSYVKNGCILKKFYDDLVKLIVKYVENVGGYDKLKKFDDNCGYVIYSLPKSQNSESQNSGSCYIM